VFTLAHFGVKYTLLMVEQKLIQVDLVALVEDQDSLNPIVILHDVIANRLLPIWIGDPEARAIAVALENKKMSRPLTHRLLVNVVEKTGGKLSRIVVDRLKGKTYFATMYIRVGKKEISIDARPSDAVAIALEAFAPIFVVKEVMDAGSQPNPFQNMTIQQEKREFKKEDIEKLRALLLQARAREEQTL
jgi:hypothetical protein